MTDTDEGGSILPPPPTPPASLPPPGPLADAGTAGPGRWTAGRVVMVIFGVLFGLLGLGLLTGGAAGLWAYATQRDDGFFTTTTERLTSPTRAITAEEVDLGSEPDPPRWGPDLQDLVTVKFEVTANDEQRVFVGIGPDDRVAEYLDGVAHDVIDDIEFDPLEVDYDRSPGTRIPGGPEAETFWVAQAAGTGTQVLTWPVEQGKWSIVIMNADAGRGIDVDVEAGARVNHLGWILTGVLTAGVLLVALGVALIVAGTRPARRGEPGEVDRAVVPTGFVPPAPAAPPVEDPVHLVAVLDPDLSRWQWIVKWFLAIPHFIVLTVLWVVAIVLTVVAAVVILFTGRYPRGIFDFNLGVLRWTWRVGFYTTSVMGTDRYPPFTLGEAPDYPARLDVARPEALRRGLVLVKSWLLALPHLLIIAILGGGLWWGFFSFRRDGWFDTPGWGSGGLLGLILVVAGVALLFTGRYPPPLFDLVMGINRWIYRVAVYCLLMTDMYPPFRLDQGGGVTTSAEISDRVEEREGGPPR